MQYNNHQIQSREDETKEYKTTRDYRYKLRKFLLKITPYLPPNVLGMTDCRGMIWIGRLYGYLKEHVLRHEVNHNLYPNASEYEVDTLARSGYPDLRKFEFVLV